MKATGIVRRIDDLGRVVIPKEIRRTMSISEGDPMEIFTTSDSVVIKKYEPSETWKAQISRLGANMLHDENLPGAAKVLIAQRLNGLLDALEEV